MEMGFQSDPQLYSILAIFFCYESGSTGSKNPAETIYKQLLEAVNVGISKNQIKTVFQQICIQVFLLNFGILVHLGSLLKHYTVCSEMKKPQY